MLSSSQLFGLCLGTQFNIEGLVARNSTFSFFKVTDYLRRRMIDVDACPKRQVLVDID